MGLTCNKEYNVDSKDCAVYKLDRFTFNDTSTLVYRVYIHQMYADSLKIPLEVFQLIFDSIGAGLKEEHIELEAIGTSAGNYWIQHKIIDSVDLMPIKKIDILNFESFAINKKKALNLYIVPDQDSNYRGNATPDIPNMNCAVQRQYIYTSTIHELLHSMGCLHTYEEDGTNGLNTETGDKVCDTHSCPPLKDIKFCTYTIPGLDKKSSEILMCNLMSDSPTVCKRTITKGQGARIKKMIEYNPNLRQCVYLKYNQ